MGRWHTGAWTTTSAQKLELSTLQKEGTIIEGAETTFTQTWGKGEPVRITTDLTGSYAFMKIEHYTAPNPYYQVIQIIRKPSNLGIGNLLYFKCPRFGCMCRILYLCSFDWVFVSRTAVRQRMYYPLQSCSKKDRNNTNYFGQLRKIEAFKQDPRRINRKYRDKTTRRGQRLFHLEMMEFKYNSRRIDEFQADTFAYCGYTGVLV